MSIPAAVAAKAQSAVPLELQIRGAHLYDKTRRWVTGTNGKKIFTETPIPPVEDIDIADIDLSNPLSLVCPYDTPIVICHCHNQLTIRRYSRRQIVTMLAHQDWDFQAEDSFLIADLYRGSCHQDRLQRNLSQFYVK